VALYGVCISSMLGFSERDARQKFRADIAHDNGKKPFFHLFEQAKTDEAVRQAIKFGHIAPENVVRIYGDDVSSAIEQHHIHQSIVPPYPRKLYFPKTPKSLLLSELMAILDFYDAVFSRPDKTTGQWLSPEEATKRTYQEYGNMVIHYTEPNFPNEVITGKKLLDALLEMRVIGRKAPSAEADVALRFNPFR
jgi:hypothetical protein